MTRRWAAAVAVVVALAAVVAGCGSNGSPGGGGSEPVTLRYAYWGPNQTSAMTQIATDFESQNPGVKVQLELTPYAQYWTKLQTATAGGESPDVFWINSTNFPQYAANKKLLSQKDWAASIDVSQYPAAVVDLYKWDGDQLAFPKDFDTVGLWYNRKLFEDAGLEVPDETWTWEDVEAAAKKLTDKAKGVYGIAAKLDPQVWYYNLVPQGGGEVISADHTKSGYDQPGSIRALQWSSDLINVHQVSPTLGQMSETDPRQMFQSGKVAMIYDGSFAAVELHKNAYTRENADVTTLPAGPAGDRSVIHGLGQAISADTEHPKEAQAFVDFMVGPSGAAVQGETGTTLPALPQGQEAWLKSMPEFNLQAFIDQLPSTYSYPTSLKAAEWQTLETKHLTQVWTGERPASEVAPQLAADMNAILEQERG